ncbi:CAP domain-containing protein [Streptococcus sanguinis]|uniref:CAP domain-containing protein n=1 Tax=Streptococcus sanguinis TaxID=1305 RepID=UPI000FA522C1|nr:CAP domain-containing protein [Streptococcus sanguinis]RSJ39921.1 Chromosome partition protein Smc [Streptococcus sanguinis]
MEKKIGKSVVATGIAATTIISGGLTHQVHADELIESTTTALKATEVTEKPVTAADVAIAQENAEIAKTKLEEQKSVVDTAKSEAEAAESSVKEAEATVEEAKENQAEATEENISKAEANVKTAEEEVVSKEAILKETTAEAEQAEQSVKNQENIIKASQSLVDVAETELKQAKTPLNSEEQAVATAKSQQSQAQTALDNAKTELTKAEQAASSAPQVQAEIQNKINQAKASLSQTNQAISSLEGQIPAAEKAAATAPVDLRNTTYSQFLENVRNNAANQEIRDAANNALAVYQRGQNEFSISVNSDPTSPASLENNLQALELVKAINAYRRNAGLQELLVDPYANVASQIQTIYFERNNWHMGKLIGNENVAISFDPQGAVNFWHSEKELYQQIAAQYGLPTDETKIDANAIYMRVGAGVFAQIGHYVQMMDNKANAISAAYDKHPNQWGTPHGTSEVGFHHISNFDQRVNNGTLLTVAAMEQLLRAGGGRSAGSNANVTALKNQLAELKAQKVGQESAINILNAQLADAQKVAATQISAVEAARQKVATAENNLALTKQNVALKQEALDRVTAKIAASLAPYQTNLSNAQAALAAAKDKLAELQSAQEAAKANLIIAQEDLLSAQKTFAAAKKKVIDLQNAPQLLAEAEQELAAAQVNFEAKQAILNQEQAILKGLEEAYNNLQETYESLLNSLILSDSIYTNALDTNYRLGEDKQTLTAVKAGATGPGAEDESKKDSDPKTAEVHANTREVKGATTGSVQAAGEGLIADFVVNPAAQLASVATTADKAPTVPAILPNTGSEAERLAIFGMALGAAAFLGTNKRRRRDEDYN